jgi:two-component system sensor histidine kinase VicK
MFDSESDRSIFLNGDPERITQVISNLVSNAIKFTDKGTIIVELRKQGGSASYGSHQMVVVSVHDSGTGVDPLIKDRLFDKFGTKSERGIGLGLYISKNIIEAHYRISS